MPIIDIVFNQKTLSSLPSSEKGQEYRDLSIPHLRVFRYKRTVTFIFKTCYQYREIREKLGNFSYLSITQAKAMVTERLYQLHQNVYEYNKSLTLNQIVERVYLPDLTLNKRNTQSERSKLNRYVLPRFGTLKLSQLNHALLSTYFIELRSTLAPSTVNRVMAIFKKIFSLCIEQGILVRSPIEQIRSFPEHNQRTATLSAQDHQRFMVACLKDGSCGAIALYLSLMTGMRIGEVINLRVSDIDFTRRVITLKKTKNNQAHVVPFTEEIGLNLQRHIKRQHCTTLLFPSSKRAGQPIAIPRYAFHKICQALKITGIVIHDLRRTCATQMLERSNDIHFVGQLLNHNSITTTLRYARYSKPAMCKQYHQLMH